jgi:hypothetical protein
VGQDVQRPHGGDRHKERKERKGDEEAPRSALVRVLAGEQHHGPGDLICAVPRSALAGEFVLELVELIRACVST